MMFDNDKLIERLVKGMRDGAIELPPDVTKKLTEAYDIEIEDISKFCEVLELGAMLEGSEIHCN